VTLTSAKIFGGITYALTPELKAGAMTRIEMYDFHIRPSLTFSMNYIPFPIVAATLSYTIMNNKFNQVGAGLALGNRGAQFYILTDNIPVRFTRDAGTSLIWPYNARMVSLRVGFNLLFNCKSKDNGQHSKKYKSSDYCPAYRQL
jgi:Trk-type K+ transport system membrane component